MTPIPPPRPTSTSTSRTNSASSRHRSAHPLSTIPQKNLAVMKMTSHIHSLARLLISHLRDISLLSPSLKSQSLLFYSRIEWKRCVCGIVGREEARIWRAELMFERWLGEVEGMQDAWSECAHAVRQQRAQQSVNHEPLERDNSGLPQSSADLILEESLQTYQSLLLASTPHNNNPPQISDHQLFSQLIKLIYSILYSQPQLIDSIYLLLRFVFLLREQYLRELKDVLQHVQRIKLRKNDERDVYKCVYSYTLEDQGAVDNDVLFELREDLTTYFIDPLSVLMSDSRMALMKLLDTVRRRIQEAYRRQLEIYATEHASYELQRGAARDATNGGEQKTIHLEFTDELVTASNAPELIEITHPGLDMSVAMNRQNTRDTIQADSENESEESPRLDEPLTDDIYHETSKMHTENVQRHATEVQEWIDRQLFWKAKRQQLHQQRSEEIEEHRSFMKRYSRQVREQQEMFERIMESENEDVIQRWQAAITIQCAYRRYRSIKWSERKLSAIELLQRVFRFYHARHVLRQLQHKQESSQNLSEQQLLWRRRQQIYAATEIADSQVVYCHIMLRKEMQETERQMEDELVDYQAQWDKFSKKSHREMMKRPLKPEWSEQVDPDSGKKVYMNIITGHVQQVHPNLPNIRKYLATEEKRHQEALENRQESLRSYRDQLIQQEVLHRSEFVRAYEEALRSVSGIDFTRRKREQEGNTRGR